VIREIGRVKSNLPEDLWHLAQQIESVTVRFRQVNPQTVQRHDSVVGEAATPFGGGDFASATNSVFS
jgi:hypothetical protein